MLQQSIRQWLWLEIFVFICIFFFEFFRRYMNNKMIFQASITAACRLHVATWHTVKFIETDIDRLWQKNNNSPNLKLIINGCAFFHLLKWISSEYSSSVCAVIRSKSFVDLIGNRIFHLIWNLNHSLNWCIMNGKHSDMSSSNSHQFIHKPLFRKFINWICFQKMEFMENCTHIVLVIAHEILLNAFVYMPSMNWSNDVKNRI